MRRLKLTPLDRAYSLIKAVRVKRLDSEECRIEEAGGRILAEDIVSPVDIPPHDRAVFDGYAIRSEDVADASPRNPVVLKIIGESYPGESPLEISSNQTVYVAFGAPLPRGADAVIGKERASVIGDEIEIVRPVQQWENVAKAGEDVKKSELIFARGHVLRVRDIALLAGMNIVMVKVFRRLMATIISVGDELIELSKLAPTRANNYALVIADFLEKLGIAPVIGEIAPDDVEEVKKRISRALVNSDLVITIGGSSLGKKDFVPIAIESLGRLLVHGIALTPGKPAGIGLIDDKPTIMLPGPIVSAVAGFYFFLPSLLALYTGLKEDDILPRVKAVLDGEEEAGPLSRFLLVSLKDKDGKIIATPLLSKGDRLSAIIKADGFMVIPPYSMLKRGSIVDITPFPNIIKFSAISLPPSNP